MKNLLQERPGQEGQQYDHKLHKLIADTRQNPYTG